PVRVRLRGLTLDRLTLALSAPSPVRVSLGRHKRRHSPRRRCHQPCRTRGLDRTALRRIAPRGAALLDTRSRPDRLPQPAAPRNLHTVFPCRLFRHPSPRGGPPATALAIARGSAPLGQRARPVCSGAGRSGYVAVHAPSSVALATTPQPGHPHDRAAPLVVP